MILVIVIAVVVGLVGGVITFGTHDSFLLGFILFTLLMGSLVGCGIASNVDNKENVDYELSSVPLVSMKNESEMNGELRGSILGIYGHITTSEFLYLMGSRGDGGYKRIKLSMSQVIIYEDGLNKMVTVHSGSKSEINLRTFHIGEDHFSHYEVHVPVGTIVQDFIID
jgi:hypothetical protein